MTMSFIKTDRLAPMTISKQRNDPDRHHITQRSQGKQKDKYRNPLGGRKKRKLREISTILWTTQKLLIQHADRSTWRVGYWFRLPSA
jgi:hypothetical protein